MNTETGKILSQKDVEKMDEITKAKCVPIDEQLMTPKQKEEMQVSKFDNRSVLGFFRIQHKNSLHNKPCPCGSGIKFKRCCWNKTC